MESSNPVLARALRHGEHYLTGERMSVSGTVNKTGLLLAIASATAAYPWSLLTEARMAELNTIMWGGMIGGLILAFATIFKPTWAFWSAPAYAACQGLALGSISAVMNQAYPGIAFEALAGTFGTLAVMLTLYRTGVIKATKSFRAGVLAATGGVAVIYLVSIAFQWFGISMSFMTGSGITGIVFSLAVVCIAALNLVLDFDLIDRGSREGAPKHMEWYGAFGLMITMVWLYVEMLRLLSKLRGRS
ncbi:MAG: Bax inhibitor-1/YccA family protein [Deltaproteobacteria bacterium]|nr:Bax inhibitor-1/YccA family protein [Deltaproteobacteria bacterium]